MDQRHQKLFRKRLHELMAGLTISEREPELRGIVGRAAGQLLTDTKTDSWMHLKSALDGKSYDVILAALQKGGAEMKAAGRPLGIRAFEAIGVSLIARRQNEADLNPIVAMLDDYIEKCIVAVRALKTRKTAAGPRQ
ncbi:MAG: hypothetical protein ABL866_11285 [Devosia sp.]